MAIYLCENIKRLRQEKGITQETLADFLGVTFQSISRWERGDGYPDITLLPAIASFFDITVDDLFGISKSKNEQKINAYLNFFDNMGLKDLSATFTEYKKAIKEFPGDFRILVRYMYLLQEAKIRQLSVSEILSGDYKKPSEEIAKIYNHIQKHCTEDSIRIWSKAIMISHLMWKYDCICNEDGKYGVYEEYLQQADEIVNTLPSMSNSREIMANDRVDYFKTHKNALEELVFLLHNELFGYCQNYTAERRIIQYESLQNILNLIYTNGDFGKNCYNALYNLGHLGYLYQQIGNDEEAVEYLRKAALYAKELDKTSSFSDKAKRFYNYGTVYRETTATEFLKFVMTEHYPLSKKFKSTIEFQEIIKSLE